MRPSDGGFALRDARRHHAKARGMATRRAAYAAMRDERALAVMDRLEAAYNDARDTRQVTYRAGWYYVGAARMREADVLLLADRVEAQARK